MPQLANTGSNLLNLLLNAFNNFVSFIPTLLGALLVLIVGWMISGAVARLLEAGLTKMGFERAIGRSGINEFISKTGTNITLSHVVGELLKWMIRLVFIQAAANILGMPQVTAIINSIILFIPKVAVALLILVVGTIAARFFGKIVQGSLISAKAENPAFFVTLAQYAVMSFAVVAALSQLEIASVIVNSLFIALIGSIALALGLAFGLGGREVAGQLTQRWFQRSQNMSPQGGRSPLREAPTPPRRTGL